MKVPFLALLFLSISVLSRPEVISVRIEGVISPPVAHYLLRGITEAERRNCPLLVEMDTPGGLLESARRMVMGVLNARVPVIVYVCPSGARAASAGLFLLEAASVAAMAPGTHAGAAHPVSFGSKLGKTMGEKVTNDAVAFLKATAKQRGRFHPFLVKMVTESKTLTASEMLKKGLIDLVAPTRDELLAAVDGKSVRVSGGQVVLRTKGQRVIRLPMSFRERLLYTLSHPSVAYMMMVLGFYGMLFELSNPGLIFPGVVGFILLVLGFYSLHVLPLNYAGFALILFSLVLFLLEVKVPSHGLLGAGATLSFLLGSFMLFDRAPLELRPSSYLILSAAAVTAAFFFCLVLLGVRALRKKPVSGREGLVGERGVAKTPIAPKGVGRVFVHGELWKARSDEPVDEGDTVEVVGIDGLTLKVRKVVDDSD